MEGGKASRPKGLQMLLLKNWDAYARGQAPHWVGSEGMLATALLFVSYLSFFTMGSADGFPELRRESVFSVREGVLYLGGGRGWLRPVYEQGEGLCGRGGPRAVVVGEPGAVLPAQRSFWLGSPGARSAYSGFGSHGICGRHGV